MDADDLVDPAFRERNVDVRHAGVADQARIDTDVVVAQPAPGLDPQIGAVDDRIATERRQDGQRRINLGVARR